ncbi:hypothetical protein X798_03099 [Onchocerca flexuosa]|uniref:Uncharacterized protein n=1 Tax=Onchocerca flexuosa TaxID=387005 RepID=A0A238BXJ3_9BILA|nr:hypothetical protein X798_03099 [Onchocerca flexuosa]
MVVDETSTDSNECVDLNPKFVDGENQSECQIAQFKKIVFLGIPDRIMVSCRTSCHSCQEDEEKQTVRAYGRMITA